LYRQYAATVLRRAMRFYDRHEAEEVVHEVFMRVWDAMNDFRGASSPVTWLWRITTNHCLNRLRDSKRRAELLVERAGEVPGTRQTSTDAETALFLRQIWRSLDPELTVVGMYHFVDGMTQDQIGHILGCSPRTVGNRLVAIRAHARQVAGLEVS